MSAGRAFPNLGAATDMVATNQKMVREKNSSRSGKHFFESGKIDINFFKKIQGKFNLNFIVYLNL